MFGVCCIFLTHVAKSDYEAYSLDEIQLSVLYLAREQMQLLLCLLFEVKVYECSQMWVLVFESDDLITKSQERRNKQTNKPNKARNLGVKHFHELHVSS